MYDVYIKKEAEQHMHMLRQNETLKPWESTSESIISIGRLLIKKLYWHLKE